MAFNAGEEKTGYTLYTGLTDVSVIAVNPTKEEAEKLGINMKNDPVYVSTDETSGNKKVRIDLYVKSNETGRPDKMAFFMEDTSKESSTTPGNKQYINDFGQNTWASSPEEVVSRVDKNGHAWFKADGIRLALSGEVELVMFIMALLSINKDQVAKLDNPKAFFTGNVSELTAIFKKFSERRAQVLYTVRENDGNWYQGIYTRYFSRAGSKTTKYWDKHFQGSTNVPNYQNSYLFQEFNPLSVGATGAPKSTDDAPTTFWGTQA